MSGCCNYVEYIGRAAWYQVGQSDWRGRVLASFSKASYLQGEDGTLLWIGTPTSVRDDRAFLVDLDLGQLRENQKVWSSGSILRVGPRLELFLSRDRVGNPLALMNGAVDIVLARNQLIHLVSAMRKSSEARGMFSLLHVGGGCPVGVTSDISSLLLTYTGQVIRDLIAAWHANDGASFFTNSLLLIGTGPGLTPSGDDILSGLYFSLHHIRSILNNEDAFIRLPHNWHHEFIGIGREKTNQISFGLLASAIVGEGPELLYRLTASLFVATSKTEMVSHARELVKIGSTSGWDLLTGMILGTSLVLESATANP